MNIFEKYGKFCANYSLEVMVCFVTMFVGAVSLNLRSPFEFCKWSFNCEANEEELSSHASSDAVLLSILRCATILYFFVKLRKISSLGSGYLVAGVCMCVTFGAIVFAATLIQLLHKDWNIVGESLPIFLLLIDLSRIVILIQHTLTASTVLAVQDRIAEAMQKIGPVVTFDTIIEILVIITSSTMKVRQLQDIFCFASLSVLLNYIIFTTFVPACLAIFLAMTRKQSISTIPEWYNEKFSTVLEKEWNKEMNPLTNKIKILLCTVLLAANGARILFGDNFPHNEHMQSSFDSVLTLTPQQFFTVTILMLLFGKFLMQEGKFQNEKVQSIPQALLHQELRRESSSVSLLYQEPKKSAAPRPSAICMELLKEDSNLLTDHEIISLVDLGKIQVHRLETTLKDPNRGVYIRRKLLNKKLSTEDQQVALTQVPFAHYNFSKATAACCENTVGYVPMPVGVVGPLLLNGEEYYVPMATTEGTLLASTNRGMKAVLKSGGVEATVYSDGMTRAPVVEFPTSREACEMASWLQDQFNFELVKDKFDETSRYARLESLFPIVCGRLLYIRFKASTGDAMGMNMVSKGAEHALRWLRDLHPNMKIISLSGNVCTDKKSSSINWVLGRGKSVVAEARIPASVVHSVLKTNINDLVHLNTSKNLIGSAMAGSIGGFNAHAANAVTAIYIATGQDPAQNVEGSNCMTILEKVPPSEECEATLLMTCTMPCIEVATCGGGTALDAQRACLNLLGVGGSSSQTSKAGHNARKLAQIVCATVLASELSLLSALSAGHLVQSHMKHNRLPTQKQKSEHSVLFNL
uniref:3-hydroxy-3-methylglutaryl-coenzyme A reductase 2-like n=1 Tax=Styela clava TaxID=7725 RepID=UPI0019397AB1|nr:3-hydroxy-3-methylglutaryl-coenzyme A reductase 2-like [Styela clava]